MLGFEISKPCCYSHYLPLRASVSFLLVKSKIPSNGSRRTLSISHHTTSSSFIRPTTPATPSPLSQTQTLGPAMSSHSTSTWSIAPSSRSMAHDSCCQTGAIIYPINAEFTRQVLFFSQQSEWSEWYIAALLDEVTKENPNISAAMGLELTVVLSHLQRRHRSFTLPCGCSRSSGFFDVDKHIYDWHDTSSRSLFIPTLPGPGGDVSLATKIWKQIEQLDALIVRADNLRWGASSNTVAPIFSGKEDIHFLGLVNLRLCRNTIARFRHFEFSL